MPSKCSFVYILVSTGESMVKIGKANDIESRYRTLNLDWKNINLKNSLQIQTTEKKVFKLEKTLHLLLDKWHIKPEEKHTGHTEWFDIKCLDHLSEAVLMINTMQGTKLKIEKLKFAGKETPKKKTYVRKSKEEREKIKEKKAVKYRTDNLRKIDILFTTLKKGNFILGGEKYDDIDKAGVFMSNENIKSALKENIMFSDFDELSTIWEDGEGYPVWDEFGKAKTSFTTMLFIVGALTFNSGGTAMISGIYIGEGDILVNFSRDFMFETPWNNEWCEMTNIGRNKIMELSSGKLSLPVLT